MCSDSLISSFYSHARVYKYFLCLHWQTELHLNPFVLHSLRFSIFPVKAQSCPDCWFCEFFPGDTIVFHLLGPFAHFSAEWTVCTFFSDRMEGLFLCFSKECIFSGGFLWCRMPIFSSWLVFKICQIAGGLPDFRERMRFLGKKITIKAMFLVCWEPQGIFASNRDDVFYIEEKFCNISTSFCFVGGPAVSGSIASWVGECLFGRRRFHFWSTFCPFSNFEALCSFYLVRERSNFAAFLGCDLEFWEHRQFGGKSFIFLAIHCSFFQFCSMREIDGNPALPQSGKRP